MEEEEYQDITKTGVGGLSGLPSISAKEDALEKIHRQNLEDAKWVASSKVYDIPNRFDSGNRYIGIEAREYGYGDSTYDTEDPITYSDLQNLNEVRSNRQSGFTKLVNGIGKGAVLAGTTFLDGTVGLVWGIGESIRRAFDDDYTASQAFAGVWDNDFSKAMQSLVDMSEKYMPNYYTKDEQENPFDNIFSANFLGDKLLKNMGFMVGAAYSGGVYTKALNATKLPQMLGAAQKSSVLDAAKQYRATRTAEDLKKYIDASKMASNTPAMVNTVVGSFMSAVNEGRIEAINGSRDWAKADIERVKLKGSTDKKNIQNEYEAQVYALVKEYENNKGKLVRTNEGLVDPAYEAYKNKLDLLTKEYQAKISDIDKATEASLKQIELDRAKMGNMTLGLNIPILTASNIKVLGKFYSGGFNTGRKSIKIKGDPGKYVEDASLKTGIRKAIGVSIVEGTEEISQKASSTTAGNYYSKDVDNFYAAQLDPEAEQQVLDFIKTASSSIVETAMDPHAWEEFLVGSISGIFGLPSFRSIKNSEGKFQSPINFTGGSIGAFKEYNQDRKRSKEAANYLNSRINSPEFKNYYQGLIRHDKYENIKDKSLQDGDKFEYNNADHAQLVSDIMMFDNAGKLDDLYLLIDQAFDYSPENIESIKKNTTVEQENGKLAGPFVDANGSNYMSDDEIKSKLEETKEIVLNTINDYIKIKNDIDISTGERFSDKQLEELVWIKSQTNNWNDRLNSLWEKGDVNLKSTLSKLFGELDNSERYIRHELELEGSSNEGVSLRYQELEKNAKNIEKAKNTISSLLHLNAFNFGHNIASNKKLTDTLVEAISDIPTISEDEVNSFKTKLEDITKIYNGIESYSKKFAEYYNNPDKITVNQKKIDNKIAEDKSKQIKKNTEDKIKNNSVASLGSSINKGDTDVTEFIDFIESAGIDASDLDSIDYENISEEQKKAIEVVKKHDAKTALENILASTGLDEETLDNALRLLDSSYESAESVSEFMDLETEAYLDPIHIAISEEEQRQDNAEAIVQEKHVRALDALSDAFEEMQKVNDKLQDTPKKTTEKTEKDSEKSGKDGPDRQDPINKDKEPEKDVYIPTPNITSENQTENKLTSVGPNETIETIGGMKQYWGLGLNEFPIRQEYDDYRDFITAVEEKTLKDQYGNTIEYTEGEIKRMKAIYNHLKDRNAFINIATGNATAGEEVYFYTNKTVNEEAGEFVVFIKNKNGLTIGVLPSENSKTFSTYAGLSTFIDEFKKEAQGKDDNEITSSKSTKIHKNMVGRVPFSSNYLKLNEVFNEGFKLGIAVDNGSNSRILVVPGRLKSTKKTPDDIENTVMSPLNTKAGTPYVLLPTSDPKRSHMPVPFIMETYGAAHENTALGKAITNVISKLGSIETKGDAIKVKEELQELLALPSLYINITKNNKLQIFYTPTGEKQEFLWGADMEHLKGPNASAFFNTFKRTLQSKEIPFQVSRKYINGTYQGQNYNSMIGEIATINVPINTSHTVNDWFTMIPVGEKTAKSPRSTRTNPNSNMAKPKEFSYNWKGIELKVDLQDFTVRDSEGKVYTGENANIVKALAFGYKNNLSGEYDTEWGFFDSTNKKFIKKPSVEKSVIDKIIEDSKDLHLTSDEKYYEDSKGNKYERVTSIIQGDPEVEPFDPTSPWILPSTTIGNEIDRLVREIFSGNVYYDKDNKVWVGADINKYPNLQGNVVDFIQQVISLKNSLESNGFTIIPDGIKAFGKIESNGKELLVAGTLDLFAVDKDGNYHIFDMKSHRGDIDQSKKVKWSKQLTLYKQLLESRYGIKVNSLNIIPIKVSYNHVNDGQYTLNNGVLHFRPLGTSNIIIGGKIDTLEKTILLSESKVNLQSGDNSNDTLPSKEEALSNATKKGLINSPKRKVLWESLTLSQQWGLLNKPSMRQKQIMDSLDRAYNIKTKEVDIKKLGKSIDELIGVTPKYRREDNSIGKISKKEQQWLDKSFPELGSKNSLRIVEGLIKISEEEGGGFAYGQFKNGIITIGSHAAKGTIYHEAFHAVTHVLLNDNEVSELFKAAREKYGNKSELSLEEDLAEAFRKYMQIEEIPFIGTGIKLFRTIKHVITNFFGRESYLDKVFYNISKGTYSNRTVKRTYVVRNRAIDDIAYIENSIQEIEERAKESKNKLNQVLKLRDRLIKERTKNKNIKWETINKTRIARFNTTKYKSKYEASMGIPEDLRDVLEVREYLGNYSIYIKSVKDIKLDSNIIVQNLKEEKNALEKQIKVLEDYKQEEYSEELLESQEIYYRRVEQHYRDKYMFGNLSAEDQQYLKDRKITIEEYNKLSPEEQEILFHCK